LNAFANKKVEPVEKVKMMVEHFEKATRAKGLSAILYEDHDAILNEKQKDIERMLN